MVRFSLFHDDNGYKMVEIENATKPPVEFKQVVEFNFYTSEIERCNYVIRVFRNFAYGF